MPALAGLECCRGWPPRAVIAWQAGGLLSEAGRHLQSETWFSRGEPALRTAHDAPGGPGPAQPGSRAVSRRRGRTGCGVADITCVPTRVGFLYLYLAVVLDCQMLHFLRRPPLPSPCGPEEVAFLNGWIGRDALATLGHVRGRST